VGHAEETTAGDPEIGVGGGGTIAEVTRARGETGVEKGHLAPLVNSEPAGRVEIDGGTSGGGAVPARRAARNGDTVAVVEEDAIAEVVDVVEATGSEAAAAGKAAAADEGRVAAEVMGGWVDRFRSDTM
jgi:hypothetical protein